jgi:hypothetical protein
LVTVLITPTFLNDFLEWLIRIRAKPSVVGSSPLPQS